MKKNRTFIVALVACLLALVSCQSAKKTSTTSTAEGLALGPKQGVYYSIFVRSFADSNGDGIGDFKGIISKLDYLNDGDDSTTDDLGITGIWLLPIFPSQSYHGYDVDDYYDVNPDYGSMADFEELLAECKKRGISVIIDMTCNHSSVYTSWFSASRDPADPHHSWYRWIGENDSHYNYNQVVWGHKLWNEDKKHKGNFYAGLFGDHMPDFNLDSPELRAEFKKVMKFWLNKGVAGFRYDAAGHVYNASKLPVGTEDSVRLAVDWWKEIVSYNKSVKADCFCVGEVWDVNSIRARYIEGLESVFHFDMGDKYIIEEIRGNDSGANSYANMLEGDLARYKLSNPNYIDAPFLSNHDQPRAAGLLRTVENQKLAAAMYLLSEGVPFVYYGEEIGMKSGTSDPTKRTPMLWNKTLSSGIPKDKRQTTWASESDCIYNKKTLSVAEQAKDPSSLLNYYKRLIHLRTSTPALYSGKLTAVNLDAQGISSWSMTCPDQKALVIHNLKKESVTFSLPEEFAGFTPIFISDEKTESVISGTVTVPPLGTLVLAGK